MPIYDYDGTVFYELGKVHDHDGSTSHPIGKVYDNDGTASHLIYTAGEYEKLEYLQTTGSQYIDTDIMVFHQSNFQLDFIAAFTAVDYNYNNLWATTDAYEQCQGWVYGWGQLSYKWGGIGFNCGTVDTAKHNYSFRKDGSWVTWFIDSTAGDAKNDGSTFSKYLRLFSKDLTTFGRAKVYGINIYVAGVLAYSLVPAKRIRDGVLGLRDTINKKFYTNHGSGEFLAGGVIDTIE